MGRGVRVEQHNVDIADVIDRVTEARANGDGGAQAKLEYELKDVKVDIIDAVNMYLSLAEMMDDSIQELQETVAAVVDALPEESRKKLGIDIDEGENANDK
jgi:hypothetical protein